MTIERDTRLFLVPPGTPRSSCGRCGHVLYWIDHQCKPKRKGEAGAIKRLPISLRHALALEPTRTTWGKGVCHIPECEGSPARRQLQPQGAPA